MITLEQTEKILNSGSFMNKYVYFFIAITIFILDRITKLAALAYAQSPYVINRYLTFELTFNRGISWGMFHDSTHIIMIIVSGIIAMITLFLCWHAYELYNKKHSIIGHVCVITGSISNLIDRAVYDGVIDFILLSYHHYSWPVFNIADVAIVCGVGFLVLWDES